MNSQRLREKFFTFFSERGHTVVTSSSLIPAEDPTLLFANAGMNQFKDLFLGHEERVYRRAASIQKCIRAGGKHNDLENVGFTARHLTFFEMMGNFSFGDYFKRDAIIYAWEFLTKEVGLDANKLYASVFEHDQEAYDLWRTMVGLPAERVVRLGAQDNFWQMGDTGPCGPCTEIYIDRGGGCGAASCAPGCSCDRFLEIWNLVFMQFNRQADGVDVPLARTGVDTGMGLDRLCAVVQSAPSVYETDLFAPIIARIEAETNHIYATSAPPIRAAFRVVADHIRSSSLAIADGGVPAADGRGYVLRKIIRRAALFADKLAPDLFFPRLVDGVITALGSVYPALIERRDFIVATLQTEVEQFARNLARGKPLLEEYMRSRDIPGMRVVPGDLAFKLYDTYGFPLELTNVVAHEHGWTVDALGFEAALHVQQARSGKKVAAPGTESLSFDSTVGTEFVGYDLLSVPARVQLLLVHGVSVPQVDVGVRCVVIPDRSPFYVECGGQVSDTGVAQFADRAASVISVQKQVRAQLLEFVAPVPIAVGDLVTLAVDGELRARTMKNHTATHLLQAALREVFGAEIRQAGSLVTPDYLRFDFTGSHQPTGAHMVRIEERVNAQVCANIGVETRWTTLAEAQRDGVVAFFGEKYDPARVRVVTVPHVSAELCGGTHVRATGEIGCFKIIEMSSLSAGTRRIVALTGPGALAEFQKVGGIAKQLCVQYKTTVDQLVSVLDRQAHQVKELQQQSKSYRQQLLRVQISGWTAMAKSAGRAWYGIVVVESIPTDELRDLVLVLAQARSAVWIVVNTEPLHEKITFAATISPALVEHTQLSSLAVRLASLGMRGGVSKMVLQGGASFLPERLESEVKAWLEGGAV